VLLASIFGSKSFERPRNLGNKTDFQVLFGVHDVTLVNEHVKEGIRANVDRVIVHPQYDNVTYNYDIALLRLEKPIEFFPSNSFGSNYRHSLFRQESQSQVNIAKDSSSFLLICQY